MTGRRSAAPADAAKRAVATAAAGLVADGMVVGLGSGSTAELMVAALGERVRDGLRLAGAVPTSERTAAAARARGIPLTTLDAHPVVDLTLDGADEVAAGTLDLIKGLGGALLREKIVAAASRLLVVMVDESKLVDRLGRRTPVPVEAVPFAWPVVAAALQRLGARAVRRRVGADGTPFVTDEGNAIADADFGAIADPGRLERDIRLVTGVIDCGLFVGRTGLLLVGGADGVRRVTPA
ncbi:MAG: ribose-5-phosphate isomerase RpiA [Alphaproteobacteria bacterium]|nr:ribose-5-phosphate isomerase RpiA [Alphaproteobacteria bacterium]